MGRISCHLSEWIATYFSHPKRGFWGLLSERVMNKLHSPININHTLSNQPCSLFHFQEINSNFTVQEQMAILHCISMLKDLGNLLLEKVIIIISLVSLPNAY